MKQDERKMLDSSELCVLSTSAGDMPNASLMQYVTDGIGRICMLTTKDRKYTEIAKNPNVSLLIDSRKDSKAISALTVYGRAELLVKEYWDADAVKRLVGINSDLAGMAQNSSCVMIRVTAEEVRLVGKAYEAGDAGGR